MGLLKFNFAKHHWRIKNEASVQPLVENLWPRNRMQQLKLNH
jgi:hypothetical protein